MYSLITILILLTMLILVDWLNWEPKYSLPLKTPPEQSEEIRQATPAKKSSTGGIVRAEVPFTAQAPFWNWGDIIYEEWCEEASIIMAVSWSRWQRLTATWANAEIKNISNFEKDLFWNFLDTSVYDTAKAMKGYFNFTQYKIIEKVTKKDIIDSLGNWNILVVPVYWRDLKNPNFTQPGPIAHMLVVTWYDPLKKQFITNDPWTKNWKSYRYGEDVLYNAIWAYPSSATEHKLPAKIGRAKTIIEVYKK